MTDGRGTETEVGIGIGMTDGTETGEIGTGMTDGTEIEGMKEIAETEGIDPRRAGNVRSRDPPHRT